MVLKHQFRTILCRYVMWYQIALDTERGARKFDPNYIYFQLNYFIEWRTKRDFRIDYFIKKRQKLCTSAESDYVILENYYVVTRKLLRRKTDDGVEFQSVLTINIPLRIHTYRNSCMFDPPIWFPVQNIQFWRYLKVQ